MAGNGPRFIFHHDIFNKETGELVVAAVVTIVNMENGRINRGDELADRIAKYLEQA